jgi:hypothetical protein
LGKPFSFQTTSSEPPPSVASLSPQEQQSRKKALFVQRLGAISFALDALSRGQMPPPDAFVQLPVPTPQLQPRNLAAGLVLSSHARQSAPAEAAPVLRPQQPALAGVSSLSTPLITLAPPHPPPQSLPPAEAAQLLSPALPQGAVLSPASSPLAAWQPATGVGTDALLAQLRLEMRSELAELVGDETRMRAFLSRAEFERKLEHN